MDNLNSLLEKIKKRNRVVQNINAKEVLEAIIKDLKEKNNPYTNGSGQSIGFSQIKMIWLEELEGSVSKLTSQAAMEKLK